ncbi:MAG: peptide ABC transporter substrate-binding protein [Ktedonobacteraceae bacterium]|nr:peptide ABC transporter substrate-binding protein [Ktedonobacteraceae bacterium]MBO0792360.1 peptide ABC transporter substrate-binding protein [Ktedonobacteraceae bacterium]
MQSGKSIVRGFLPSLLCVLAVLLVACGGGGTNQNGAVTKASDDKQIYISPLGNRTDIKTFDPALATDLDSISAIQMVYTGLVSLNDKLEVQDQLAASHSVSADGLTWTFKLKPGLKFSDGTPLTSKDVAYSIDRALQPATKSGAALTYLGLIKDADKLSEGKISTIIGDGIQTPDDQTVVIITSQKAAYFLETLTYNTSFVIEKSMIDKYGDKFADHLSEGIGGAGPWKVSKYVHGQAIEFVPNPNYYGKQPQLKKVVMPFYQQSDTVWQVYQTGQVHSSGVPSSQLDTAKNLPNKQFHQSNQLGIYFYAMNFLAKPFNNLKVRQAFALAINKDDIANKIYKGSVVPTNHIVPSGMPGYNESLTGPQGVKDTKGNRDLAKQLFNQGLQEEGMTLASLPPITFTTSANSDTSRNEVAAVQQMWESTLGVKINLETMEFNKLLDEIDNAKGNPKGLQIWRADWYADYPDPQDWLTLLFSKDAHKNAMNYGDNQTPQNAAEQANQALMVQADANNNDSERMQQYNKAEQELVNDVAWIPIYQDTSTYVLKPCVVGVVDNAQGLTPPDDWANIYISTDSTCADTSQYSIK